jgi:phenylpropionate dioxygenase-like ring-hydroxylating dioxygenase large terminal subunit
VKLSLGRVERGELECRYHGWRYDGAGQCVCIPSLTSDQRMPEKIATPAFRTIERDGYVWVWAGAGEPTFQPRIEGFEQHRWRQGSFFAQCDATKLVENNLDWCHVPFVHRWTHPYAFVVRLRGVQDGAYETRLTDRGMLSFAPAANAESAPIPKYAPVGTFELPYNVSFAASGFEVIFHHVPTSPTSCRVEWLFRSSFQLALRRVKWTHGTPKITRQDKEVCEAVEAGQRDADFRERSVESDASTLLVRRIIEMAERREWDRSRSSMPTRRVVAVRS